MGDVADLYDEYDESLDENDDVQCKYCKRRGFTWFETELYGWRLITATGRLHICNRLHIEQV